MFNNLIQFHNMRILIVIKIGTKIRSVNFSWPLFAFVLSNHFGDVVQLTVDAWNFEYSTIQPFKSNWIICIRFDL